MGYAQVTGDLCLTRLSFNPTNTILIAAEEGGKITTLKLSSTLNKPVVRERADL